MRGETNFKGEKKKAQIEALRFIVSIAIESCRDCTVFDSYKLLHENSVNKGVVEYFELIKIILTGLYGQSGDQNYAHRSGKTTCCWNTLLCIEGVLVGHIAWFSTLESGALVKIVFGDKEIFAMYDTGYVIDELGFAIERGSSTKLGLPRDGDTTSSIPDRHAFLKYVLSVSKDSK